METFTVFTLAGPLASFGGVAGNERRGSMDRPGHSMLIGLVTAALGVRRSETERLAEVSDACRFAVRSDAPGEPVLDYHTVQSASPGRGFAPATRRELLEGARKKDKLATSLTRREYRADVRFTIAVAIDRGRSEILDHADLCRALKAPAFTLYLGRKACPPALPLNPHVLKAASAEDAFVRYDDATGRVAADVWPVRGVDGQVSGEVAALGNTVSNRRRRVERRRVKPLSRLTWQFALLDDLVLLDTGRGDEPR